jgi:hypothetical protein
MVTGFFAPMRDGAPRAFWAPMLTVSLSDSIEPNKMNIVATELLALVDTGADACYIDIQLAQQFHLKQYGTLSSFSAAGQVDVPRYEGQIILADNIRPTILHMIMVGADLQRNGFRHRFLIGMEGLQSFEMILRRRSERFSLEWVS